MNKRTRKATTSPQAHPAPATWIYARIHSTGRTLGHHRSWIYARVSSPLARVGPLDPLSSQLVVFAAAEPGYMRLQKTKGYSPEKFAAQATKMLNDRFELVTGSRNHTGTPHSQPGYTYARIGYGEPVIIADYMRRSFRAMILPDYMRLDKASTPHPGRPIARESHETNPEHYDPVPALGISPPNAMAGAFTKTFMICAARMRGGKRTAGTVKRGPRRITRSCVQTFYWLVSRFYFYPEEKRC
uniref:Uncharacterized protein n=1 Tax=Mycena chlorophos TaxID=658473 RepID=A0ABQ0LR35_MYCCL|nr:predicted protein [Mycena chlorophos]